MLLYFSQKIKGIDMKIDTNAVVTIDFEMTNNDGTVIDSTKDDALVYIHGHQNIMPESRLGMGPK